MSESEARLYLKHAGLTEDEAAAWWDAGIGPYATQRSIEADLSPAEAAALQRKRDEARRALPRSFAGPSAVAVKTPSSDTPVDHSPPTGVSADLADVVTSRPVTMAVTEVDADPVSPDEMAELRWSHSPGDGRYGSQDCWLAYDSIAFQGPDGPDSSTLYLRVELIEADDLERSPTGPGPYYLWDASISEEEAGFGEACMEEGMSDSLPDAMAKCAEVAMNSRSLPSESGSKPDGGSQR